MRGFDVPQRHGLLIVVGDTGCGRLQSAKAGKRQSGAASLLREEARRALSR